MAPYHIVNWVHCVDSGRFDLCLEPLQYRINVGSNLCVDTSEVMLAADATSWAGDILHVILLLSWSIA